MTPRPTRTVPPCLLLLLALLLTAPVPAPGQFIMRPSLGVQSVLFNGDYPASRPISPGTDPALPLGGGLVSTNNAARLQLEMIPDPLGMLRIPVSVEYYSFIGKTSFTVPNAIDPRVQRLTYRYSADMLSVGAGLTASFFGGPTLYFSAEGKFNYFFPSELGQRLYYQDNGEAILERSINPDPSSQQRIGAYLRVGTQVDFFDPVLLDFSVGYGALNLFGKNTDPATQRNLLVAEPKPTPDFPEVTVGYLGVGFSIIWAM